MVLQAARWPRLPLDLLFEVPGISSISSGRSRLLLPAIKFLPFASSPAAVRASDLGKAMVVVVGGGRGTVMGWRRGGGWNGENIGWLR